MKNQPTKINGWDAVDANVACKQLGYSRHSELLREDNTA